MKKKQIVGINGEPIAKPKPKQPEAIEQLTPLAANRMVLFEENGETKHVLERKFENTYQVVATSPERFSPLLGMFLIFKDGYYHRLQPKMGKDALGRPKEMIEVVQIYCFEDKPL
jgi:hypothetical protein